MLETLDRFLAQVARLMVARGVSFPDLAERLKMHYVRAAEDMSEGKSTDSWISVITGLQRRDISRLKGQPPKPERPNHLATLVATWRTEPSYQGRALPKNGPAPSFESLAKQVRKDVHPRTMLDALEAAGTVAVTEDGDVELRQSSYQPLSGSDDQIAYLSRNVADHLAVATDNVLGENPPRFERAVHYSGLTQAEIEDLTLAHHEGQMALFEALSEKAAAMKALPRDGARFRFRAGAYFYPGEDDAL